MPMGISFFKLYKKQPESHDPDCLQIYKSNTTNKIIEALYTYYE